VNREVEQKLIRRDQERRRPRELLLDGAASAPTAPADESYFAALRERACPKTPA
jgi:antitoxin ParD1/3/4